MKHALHGFFKNFSYNFLSVIIMNVVIQFVVYPVLSAEMGESSFGTMLSLMSIITVFSSSFALALNNTRLVLKNSVVTKNGDYNTLLVIFATISIIVAIISVSLIDSLTFYSGCFFSLLSVLSLMRGYSDVDFRLELNFKKYFINFIFISVGYLLGVLLFQLTKNWYLVFMLGDICCLIFVFSSGTIYKKPFECSSNRKKVWKTVTPVTVGYMIGNFYVNFDRILLQTILGGAAVTVFYVASLVGKTAGLLTGPLNSVLLATLADYSGRISTKKFTLLTLISLGLGAALVIICVLVSPFLLQLLYPSVYSQAKSLIFIANMGQCLFFASGLVMSIALRFCSAKLQLIVQTIYGIIFTVLAIPMTFFYGIVGFAYSSAAANFARFVLVYLLAARELKCSSVARACLRPR